MITPVSPTYLKQEAKKLKKSHGLLMSNALDEISKKYGFSNYRHYLNIYESNLKQSRSTKEILLKNISLEKDMTKRVELAIQFIQSVKIPLRDLLDILEQFQHSAKAIQMICKKLNVMKSEIQKFLLNYFFTDEGQYEINFRASNFVAKEISVTNLTYEIQNGMLYVDGNYNLTTEFEFELDKNDPISEDDRFKNRRFDGSFGVEIHRDKKINFVHFDMSMDNGLIPMHGFTEMEVEDYYKNFPDERGRFDDMLVFDNSDYKHIKNCLSNKEPLTGKSLEIALELVDVHGDDEHSIFVRNIGTKMKAGLELDEYEHHIIVDVLMLHAQLGS
ncbi:hypothetical protein [Legionella micdadei]|uniref:Uncharacterized protein n=1 Tax=Legionella micdadei TaxID=451 RepID=A0A098GDH8_LEGMI|nr:hypothetical protein [Legionella micdadei]ARG98265.1 hypothetical protein B6N58_11680 [Legionella micdadei]KTD29850.1 hypothetical protein Lmic_0455 [Legionella micdadei]CEG60070.1 conserved protein of unknown function [Legionella micdadei]SCY79479.1 hypothetical protein SAMN02982997_02950 [Legionella micdadei]